MKTKNAQITPLALIMAIAMVAGGLKGLIWVVNDTSLILASKHWATTEAVITKSELEKSGSKGGIEFSPEVEFSFQVDNRIIVGNRFEIPSRRSSNEAYERLRLGPYPVGMRTKVLFDPADPKRSVLLRPEISYWFTIGMGMLSLILMILGAYFFFRLLRKSRPSL